MTNLPQTREEAICFANALREFALGDDAAVEGDCISVTGTACLIDEEVETYFGLIDGAGHHVIVVGDWLIDVTADQFGRDPIRVLHLDEIDGTDYGGFRPSNFRKNYRVSMAGGMEKFWEVFSEFST